MEFPYRSLLASLLPVLLLASADYETPFSILSLLGGGHDMFVWCLRHTH